jgi:hypothetical protein
MHRQIALIDKEELYQELKQTLGEGKRAMVCFRTKADRLVICSQLAKDLPALAANPAAILTSTRARTRPNNVSAATERCCLLAFTKKELAK